MASKALTQAAIEKMKPPAARHEVADGLLPGLYLVVQPSGHKSWAVRTRVAGRQVKYTLGDFPVIPLKAARDLARAAIIKAKGGVNPIEEKRAKQREAEATAGNTMRAVAEEYMAREGKRLRTMDQRRAIFDRLVYPTLGSRPIDAVSRTDIVRLLDRIEDENGARMADYALATLRRAMNWHASRSDTFRSPIVRGMTRHEAEARSRTLNDDELRAVWRAAADGGVFGAFVRFLLLTAARRSEAAAMRWDEVDGTDWVLPAARNKTKAELARPLSWAAQHLLASIPRVEGCAYVFSNDHMRPVGGFDKAKKAFDRASGVTGWVLHDLRRSARSLMSRAGVPTDHAERCLGHVIGGVRAVYDRHEFHREKQQAFEALAALVERIVSPVDNVTALRR